MADPGERKSQGALYAWRGVALAAAVWLSLRALGLGDGTHSLAASAAGAWLLIGWRAVRPARAAATTSAVVLAAAVFAWRLPWAFALFVPAWAALFWLPSALHFLPSEARPPLSPRASEALRTAAACAAGLAAMLPFLHDGIMGGADAKWYTTVVADHLEQWRLGMGPVFVGQTRFAAMGAVMPIRVAPYLQHATLFLDLATGRALSPYLLLNLAVALSSVAGCLSAYLCLKALLPTRRTEALLLAVLYAWCPAVAGLAYGGQLFMSVMTLPFLPVVFAGVARIFSRDGFSGWAMVAAGCAACWLAHSPIGFWVTVCAATAIACRWAFGGGPTRREVLRAAGAALLFAGLCGYVFLSVRLLAAAPGEPTPAANLPRNIRDMFPAVLEPVSPEASRVTDLQPGWSLLAALAAAAIAGIVRRSGVCLALMVPALLLVCLSLPVPLVDAWAWRALPQAVVDVTNAVPGQRLFPILAACTAVLCAASIAASEKRRRWVLTGLSVGVLWSGLELRRFVHRGSLISNTRAASEEMLAANNLDATVYSTGLLGERNSFFSHGYMDFGLEQRILAVGMDRYLATNVGAVAPGFDFGGAASPLSAGDALVGSPAANGRRWIELGPTLTLEAGRHYLLALEFEDHAYTGVLQVSGPGVLREYILPLSGGRHAFGALRESSHVIPLFNPSPTAVPAALDFVVEDPAIDLGAFRDFAHYALLPYDPETLPVRLTSYAPYVAQIRSPAAGWLETFRYHTDGWTALVNGRPADVKASPNGLVTVRVGAGSSEVRLIYRAPAVLLASYWLTWAAWAGLGAAAARRALRSDFHGGSGRMP